MCLLLSESSKFQIAIEDIPVVKLLVRETWCSFLKAPVSEHEILYSPVYRGTSWKLGSTNKAEIRVSHFKDDDDWQKNKDVVGFQRIYRVIATKTGVKLANEHLSKVCRKLVRDGIHSSDTFKRVSDLMCTDSSDVFFDAIIPKGAVFIRNEKGDYVSSKLKIVGVHEKQYVDYINDCKN